MKNMRYILMVFALILNLPLFAQSGKKIELTISDATTTDAIPGVSIAVRGAKYFGGVTDPSGLYSFEMPNGEAVEVTLSYPGYKTETHYLSAAKSYDFKLVSDEGESFADKISTPFRDVAHGELTTSAGAVTYDKSQIVGATSVEDFLRSSVPGVYVQSKGGMPGQAADVMIRGRRSLSGSTYPLLVINGVMMESTSDDGSNISNYFDSALRSIDINDVESITVMKSGNSIYGSKGSAGVIIINTHRPLQTETTVEFAANFGVSLKPENIQMMDADEHKTLLYEQMASSGLSVSDIASKYPWMAGDPSYAFADRYDNDTQWQDAIYRNAFAHDYHLSIKGGDAVAKYVFGLGYTKQGATLESSDYERFNARLNADIKIAKKIDLLINTSYAITTNNVADDMTNMTTSLIGSSLMKSPLFHSNIIDSEGIIYNTIEDVDPLGVANPATIMESVENKLMGNDFNGSARLVYHILPNLNVSNIISANYYKLRGNGFAPYYGIGGFEQGDRLSNRYINEFLGIYNDTRVDWAAKFGVDHNLNATLGYRVSMNSKEQDNMNDYSLANDEFKASSTSSAATSNVNKKFINGAKNIWNWTSAYAQVNYSFRRLFYVDASLAADSSSKFSANNRTQFFPAVSTALRLSSLPALQDSSWLRELKLRAGWDVTGNEDIGCYSHRRYYTSNLYRGFSGVVLGNIGNEDIKNETTSQFNVGLDFEAFDSRLRLSADAYWAETSDVLVEDNIDFTEGNTFRFSNNATIADRGVELALAATIINNRDFQWRMGANASFVNSEVTALKGKNTSAIYGGTTAYIVGEAPGAFYGYKAEGVYATTSAAEQSGILNADGSSLQGGDMIYANLNGDQSINKSDMTVIGSPLPEFYGGVNTAFSYKGLTLSASLDLSYGNEIFNYVRMQTESMSGYNNQSTSILNRWSSEGQITDMPRAVYGRHNNSAFSSRWIEDGSYIRLRDITLSYDFKFNKGIEGGQVYVSGNNLFTSTKYLGYDPEVGISGVDYGAIPVTKGVVFGLKLNL